MIRIFSKNLWSRSLGKFAPGFIEIDRERISGIQFGKPNGAHAKKKFLDLGNLFLAPSGVDVHIHSRDFDEHHKETFESLEAGALQGGVSAGACMANTFPRLDSVAQLKLFFAKTKSLQLKLFPFAAVTKNLEGKDPTDWNELLKLPIIGLSDDGKPLLDEKIFRAALKASKRVKKIISLHEEDTRISNASILQLSPSSMRWGVEGSPAASEVAMVARDIEIARNEGAHIHFAHISAAESVKLIRAAKKKGAAISAELTPHHALLTVNGAECFELEKLSRFKVCPVIRSEADQAELHRGLRDGSLDCFASDHAPHSHFEKDLPMSAAAHGMISLENYFPLLNEVRHRTRLNWKTFFEAFTYRPASLLPAGQRPFEVGSDATFIIFDPEATQTLEWKKSKSQNTPFENFKVRGVIMQHWIRGKKLYAR